MLKTIALSLFRESKFALRPVNRNTDKYAQIVDSIKEHGVLNPISAREMKDPDTGETFYVVTDGLHRFTASVDAGKTEIDAKVMDGTESEILERQIVGNLHKIETRPAEYSKQLVKILALNPLMTFGDLAKKVSQSRTWLEQRLGLADLPEAVATLVDEGKIPLTNAYALAKLKDNDEIANFLERAMTNEPEVFVGQVNARAKELRDAKRQGREAKGEEFVPTPRLQKLGDIKSEAQALSTVHSVLKHRGLSDPIALEAAKATLEWVLHLDPISLEKSKSDFEAQKKAREEKNAKSAKDRAEAKAAKAKENAEKAEAELSKLA